MKELDAAMQIIKEAGSHILKHIGDAHHITIKGPTDFSTEIDIEVERLITTRLHEYFPQHRVYAEESGIEPQGTDHVWIVDPISATTNFVHRIPHYAVSMALEYKDEAILGLVYDPFADELFVGVKNQGVMLNGVPIHASQIDALKDALLIIGVERKEYDDPVECGHFLALVGQCSGYRRIGSLALELCYVACGRADGLVYNFSDVFSVTAAKCILEEAGCLITDFSGENWSVLASSVVAANQHLHPKLIETTMRSVR